MTHLFLPCRTQTLIRPFQSNFIRHDPFISPLPDSNFNSSFQSNFIRHDPFISPLAGLKLLIRLFQSNFIRHGPIYFSPAGLKLLIRLFSLISFAMTHFLSPTTDSNFNSSLQSYVIRHGPFLSPTTDSNSNFHLMAR